MTTMTYEKALSIFGFSEDDKPSLEKINSAYKKIVLEKHPDKNPIDAKNQEEKIYLEKKQNDEFNNICEAYATLKLDHQTQCNTKKNYIKNFSTAAAGLLGVALFGIPSLLLNPLTAVFASDFLVKTAFKLANFVYPPIMTSTAEQKALIVYTGKFSLLHDSESDFQKKIRGIVNALTGIISTLYFGIFSLILNPIVFGLSGRIFADTVASTRQELTEQAVDQLYDSVEKIARVVEPLEKRALQLGVEALSYKGYFLSFKESAAYKHYVAFLAGQRLAMTHENERVEKIRQLLVL